MKISHYWKAVVAGVAAGSGSVATAINDGVLTGAEAWTAVGAVMAALGFTWWVPNRQQGTNDPYQR